MAASTSFVKWIILLLLLLLFFSTTTTTNALNYTSSSQTAFFLHGKAKSICRSTPYPDVCFDSLKLSISININPNIITYLLQTLQNAISEAGKLSILLSSSSTHSNIIEKQRGTLQDCNQLHEITLSSLHRSVPRIQAAPHDSRKLADARAFLSAALTNKNTCLEGLDSATGPLKPTLVNSILNTYKHVSNTLSMLSKPGSVTTSTGRRHEKEGKKRNRRLLGLPEWVSRKDRRILLETSGDDYDPGEVLTVSADGTGNFTTIMDAVNFAPNNSYDRIIIYIKEGVYEENVEIPSNKPNIMMVGDGSDATLITASRSVVDGWTTFRSATVAVSGEGFLARDIAFENSAGAEKQQAVALKVNADLAAFYRCSVSGYQDTLYVHSFRQFYRECDISGSIDFIFGNAAVVFQACNIISRMPLPGQFTVITAQSRDSPDEATGISIQNCTILATDELYMHSPSNVKSYLGRPWRVYSRTVYLESYVDNFIDPSGWAQWSAGNEDLDVLYYGEYNNYGSGSGTERRVDWEGYHIMDDYDASNFTVSEFLTGDEWLESTAFPYDNGI